MDIITMHLSHADRNHILEVLEDNQTNLTSEARSIRQKLDTSIGISQSSYPVDLTPLEVFFLKKEIQKFSDHSRNIVLQHLAGEKLNQLLTQIKARQADRMQAISEKAQVTLSLSKGTAREALKSAFIITVLACLVVWAVIETVNYYLN